MAMTPATRNHEDRTLSVQASLGISPPDAGIGETGRERSTIVSVAQAIIDNHRCQLNRM
jgi:hypothetical protein